MINHVGVIHFIKHLTYIVKSCNKLIYFKFNLQTFVCYYSQQSQSLTNNLYIYTAVLQKSSPAHHQNSKKAPF